MRRSDDSRWSLLLEGVQGPPAGVILHCGRNNEKSRPGSFSWSQGPRPQVHCRNFPSTIAFFWWPFKPAIPGLYYSIYLHSRHFRTDPDLTRCLQLITRTLFSRTIFLWLFNYLKDVCVNMYLNIDEFRFSSENIFYQS